MTPIFYFTVHRGDMMRSRLIKGCRIMLVAAAFWDDDRKRFNISRPPADHIESIVVDPGGFTAARRWGSFPWTPSQLVDWVREESRDVVLDWCAVMDYACEPNVNRSILPTNRARIEATIENEIACKEAAPDLPWLPVLQGDNLVERAYDLDRRRGLNLLPDDYAGIGSVCGRGAGGAKRVVKFYNDQLPGVKYHGFGMHIQALDDDSVYSAVRSWDSYGWNWGKGQKDKDRPQEYLRREGETYSQFTGRLSQLYWKNTIEPRLARSRQKALW